MSDRPIKRTLRGGDQSCRRRRAARHPAEHRPGGFGPDAPGVVAGGDEQLPSGLNADACGNSTNFSLGFVMVAYLLAPWGELGASATPRVRRLFTASYPTFGYTSELGCRGSCCHGLAAVVKSVVRRCQNTGDGVRFRASH